MLICSAPIDGPQNRAQNPKTLVKPFKFLLKSVHLPLLTTLHALQKDDYDSMLFGGHLRPFSGFKETVDLYPLFWCTFFSKFRDFDDFGPFLIEKWTFWTTFWGPLTASCPKSHDISAFNPKDPLRTCSKPCYFDPILTILDPLRVLGEVAAGPNKMPLGWRTCLDLPKPMPGPSNLVILTTFPIEKSQFCHFAYQGSKMPFWPYFDPIFMPSLSPNLWLLAKMLPIFPLCPEKPWRTLRTLILTLIWPFWTPFEGPGGKCS